MAKRLSKEEKKEQTLKELIDKMFEIAGHPVTFNDVVGRKDEWYLEWSMSEPEYEEWQKWGAELLRKKFKLGKLYAEREMAMIGLMWGLKFKKSVVE